MVRKFMPIGLLICSNVFGQVIYQSNSTSISILPTSKLTPITTVTPQSINQSEEECGKLDLDLTTFKNLLWFGNNNYLYQFLDSMGYPITNSSPAARVESNAVVRYRVPIKFWVYRRDDGTGGVAEDRLKTLMNKINDDFRLNFTGIRFFQSCEASFINDSGKLSFDGFNQALTPAWVAGRSTNGAINVHIVQDIVGVGGLFNPLTPHAVFIEWQTAIDNPSTLSHEIGHLFNLQHTHHLSNYASIIGLRNCLVEPVDRNRRYADFTFCHGSLPFQNTRMSEVTGDALSDTPADPKLSVERDQRVNDCMWVDTNLTDHFGDFYGSPPVGSLKPDARNIMSYSYPSCRNSFSYGQVGVMVNSIEKDFIFVKARWKSGLDLFDTYEPDNSLLAASNITINEIQERTFHFGGAANPDQACDTDWVKFSVTNPKRYILKTSAIPGKTNADTELRLHGVAADNSLSLISSDDNSAGNGFSVVDVNLNSGNFL